MRTILQRLSAVLVLTTFSFLTAGAQEWITIDSLEYLLHEEEDLNRMSYTATVMGYVNGIKVPKILRTIKLHGVEYKVNSLGAGCFENCSSLTTVTIPETKETSI